MLCKAWVIISCVSCPCRLDFSPGNLRTLLHWTDHGWHWLLPYEYWLWKGKLCGQIEKPEAGWDYVQGFPGHGALSCSQKTLYPSVLINRRWLSSWRYLKTLSSLIFHDPVIINYTSPKSQNELSWRWLLDAGEKSFHSEPSDLGPLLLVWACLLHQVTACWGREWGLFLFTPLPLKSL